MAGHHVDATYVTNPLSIAYLTGFRADPLERLMALAVRAGGATLVVPALERERAEERARDAEVVAWRDGEDPYGLVANALSGARDIAVEKRHLSLHAAETLTERAGAAELVDAGAELSRMRLHKRPREIAQLTRAAEITDAVCERAFAHARAGQSEIELALVIDAAIGELGGTLSFETLVQSGPNSALPHARPGNRKLEAGDLVLLDFGAAFDGYRADTTRMGVVGEPAERQREIHRIVLEAHDAAIAAVRPGVTTGEVDAAARRVIDAAGYGEHFSHRVGHGIGLDAHEEPSLDPGSTTLIEPGMVFTVEPGIYVAGWGGVRIEDDIVAEESGCRVLTTAHRSLRVIRTA